MSAPLKAAVIGAGHMGRHHARLYAELPDTELVVVVDTDADRAKKLADAHGARADTTIEPYLDRIEAASLAVPTTGHYQVAEPLIYRRVPILIEKPLAPNVAEATRLLDLADEHESLVQVGHSERFNPVILAVDRMNITPKFIETHRISPFTFRSADIGVVLDMMIHDIDIVLHLVKTRDYRVDAVGINVLGAHEDIANARIHFANGCVVNMTASRLALKTERKIRVFSQEAYLSLDYQKKSGIAIKKNANLDLLRLARQGNIEDLSQMQAMDFGKMVKVEPLVINDVEPLRAEIEAFVNAIRNNAPPPVSAEDGVAAVKLAEEIVASASRHPWTSDDPAVHPLHTG